MSFSKHNFTSLLNDAHNHIFQILKPYIPHLTNLSTFSTSVIRSMIANKRCYTSQCQLHLDNTKNTLQHLPV